MGRDKMDEGAGTWPELLKEAQKTALGLTRHPAVEQVGAVALQLGLSYTAYEVTLALAHVAAGVARIHSATPLLAPLWGVTSVAAASVAAGHVSRSTLAALRQSNSEGAGGPSGSGGSMLVEAVGALPGHLAASWDVREAFVDAVLGPLAYKIFCRHDFHRLLPSHLAKPGAFGRLHVPTSASEYATASEKAQVSVLFGRDGCHHCGTRSNGVIGDHQPPYKVVRDQQAARDLAGGLETLLRRIADAVGLQDRSLLQVYYAQCRGCSSLQAQLMRNGTRTTRLPGVWPPELVAHHPSRLATRPFLPALLVGMRYYVNAAVQPQGPGGGRKGGGGGWGWGWGTTGGKAGRGDGKQGEMKEGGGGRRWFGWRRWSAEDGAGAVAAKAGAALLTFLLMEAENVLGAQAVAATAAVVGPRCGPVDPPPEELQGNGLPEWRQQSEAATQQRVLETQASLRCPSEVASSTGDSGFFGVNGGDRNGGGVHRVQGRQQQWVCEEPGELVWSIWPAVGTAERQQGPQQWDVQCVAEPLDVDGL